MHTLSIGRDAGSIASQMSTSDGAVTEQQQPRRCQRLAGCSRAEHDRFLYHNCYEIGSKTIVKYARVRGQCYPPISSLRNTFRSRAHNRIHTATLPPYV